MTWKVFTARPSSVVRHLACEMLTPCSVKSFDIAAKRPGRSEQVTCTATGLPPAEKSLGGQAVTREPFELSAR